MYSNLKAEMARNRLVNKDIAKILNVTEKTAREKINGTRTWKIDEAFLVRDTAFPDLSVEYLFQQGIIS